jgi:XTP/dITP diphosphohydrolase
VPLAQPALALAAKLVSRASRAGLDPAVPAEDEIGARLFAVVQEAVAAGVDPEGALRQTTRRYLERLRAEERARADVP